MIEKILPIMLCKLLNYLIALKKCRILHIKNLTSNTIFFEYEDFNELSAETLIVAYIFEIWNKKIGVSDVNFEI